MTQFTRAVTRHNFIGPGPGFIIKFVGQGRACVSTAGLGQARPVQGPDRSPL